MVRRRRRGDGRAHIPINHRDTRLVVLVGQHGMNELPVWRETASSGDKVDLRELSIITRIEPHPTHSIELVVFSLDDEIPLSLIYDLAHRPTHVDFLP